VNVRRWVLVYAATGMACGGGSTPATPSGAGGSAVEHLDGGSCIIASPACQACYSGGPCKHADDACQADDTCNNAGDASKTCICSGDVTGCFATFQQAGGPLAVALVECAHQSCPGACPF
jgi:hypothetical protein